MPAACRFATAETVSQRPAALRLSFPEREVKPVPRQGTIRNCRFIFHNPSPRQTRDYASMTGFTQRLSMSVKTLAGTGRP